MREQQPISARDRRSANRPRQSHEPLIGYIHYGVQSMYRMCYGGCTTSTEYVQSEQHWAPISPLVSSQVFLHSSHTPYTLVRGTQELIQAHTHRAQILPEANLHPIVADHLLSTSLIMAMDTAIGRSLHLSTRHHMALGRWGIHAVRQTVIFICEVHICRSDPPGKAPCCCFRSCLFCFRSFTVN